MERREFLFGLAAAPLTLVGRDPQRAAIGHLSMVLGPTDGTSFQLSVVHDKTQILRYFVRIEQTGLIYPSQKMGTVQRADSHWAATLVDFSGVPEYAPASIIVEDEAGKIRDIRPIRWLDSRKLQPRVALASCAAGYLYNSDIWQRLNDSDPDLVIFLGDNIYGDRPNMVTKRPADPKQLWSQYVQARNRYDFYFRRELVPTIATWDDHDFGLDDGDSSYVYSRESREMFAAFWPQSGEVTTNLENGPGVASSLTAFGMEFILLDSRTERTPAQSAADRTTWGQAQRDWLEHRVKSSVTPLWLGNGQQFFGANLEKYNVENEYPLDFDWLTRVLRESGRSVGFLSGDVHFSEISDIEPRVLGYPTVEITSSSLHSVTFPGQHNLRRNPRRRVASSSHNFVMLEAQVHNGGIRGRAQCIMVGGRTSFYTAINFGF